MNTSATGGYLQPAVILDQNDQVLARFLQQLVSGITGVDGTLVRPRWQDEPPTQPDFSTDWIAVGETRRKNDTFGYDYAHTGSQNNAVADSVYRNGILDILCSFYGPNCQQKCELLSMGFQIAQNREQMQLNGFGFMECEDPVLTADLLHNRWVRRVDMTFRVRRAQQYESYGILDLRGTDVIVKDDTGAIHQDFVVTPSSVILGPVFFMDIENKGVEAGIDEGYWHP